MHFVGLTLNGLSFNTELKFHISFRWCKIVYISLELLNSVKKFPSKLLFVNAAKQFRNSSKNFSLGMYLICLKFENCIFQIMYLPYLTVSY